MKITKYHFIIGILVIVVIFLAACLGIWLGSDNSSYRTIAEGIIISKENQQYESTILTTYTEYTDLLNEHNIARDVFLTSGDFEDYDYIVDYINYEDDLVIENIEVEITDAGANIKYVVNKEVTDSDEILIYFIKINKNTLSEYKFASREFEVK